MLEAAAALIAWLGAADVVLADGRRGQALGIALLTVGLAVLAWPAGMAVGSIAIAAGGLVAAARCWGSGDSSWGIMPAGSTPRLVLCIGSGLLALWLAGAVTTGPGGSLRFAVFVVLGLMGARILMSRDAPAALAAVAPFALGLAAAAGLAASSEGPAPAIVGALVAAGVMFVPSGIAPAKQSARPGGKDGA